MGCWHGYLSGAMCRFAYGPADATATQIQIGFSSLVLARPGSPGQRAVKRVCVFIINPPTLHKAQARRAYGEVPRWCAINRSVLLIGLLV